MTTRDRRDYYRLLGVDPRSDRAAIHRAYRDLARRFHPDVTGDESTMKLINVAWDALRDEGRRATYDAERGAPPPSTIAAGAPATSLTDHAGPPPGKPFGPVLTYGRYEGWSLGEIALVDPGYLEWLRQAPGYRWLRADVEIVLRSVDPAPSTPQRSRPSGRVLVFARDR
jgi:curved DNA-binding protein CbpA